MREIFKQNSIFLLLFIVVAFSNTANAQQNENEGGFNWDGMNDLDNVNVGGDSGSDDSWDHASLYWNTEPNDYGSNYEDYDEPYDWRENNDQSENEPPINQAEENQKGQNIIDKPIITSAELVKLIADLAGRYIATSKYDYVLTTSDGTTHIGTITKLYDPSTGHSLYYFMPYDTDTIFKEGLQYKIPEPGDNSLPTNATGPVDWQGMPIGFYTIMSNIGNIGVHFSENDSRLENYCEECTKIERVDNPKLSTLARVLKVVKPLVLNNPSMLKNFMLLTGYNKEQVEFLLWEESLKFRMRAADISNWGLYERWVTPSVFFVRKDLVDSLETGGYKVSGSDLTVNDTGFFIAMIIVHELIHYARGVNNLPQKVGTYEAGQVFENNVFGKVLGSSNVKNLWKQYGFYF